MASRQYLQALRNIAPCIVHMAGPRSGQAYVIPVKLASNIRSARTVRHFSAKQPHSQQPSRPLGTSVDGSNINTFREVVAIRDHRNFLRGQGRSVGLVPTMGAFHEGHLELVRKAAQENDEVFVSIFVNPTQFGVNEDLDAYPRTFDSDMEKLRLLNADFESANRQGRVTVVFAPTVQEMYPTAPPTSEIDGKGSFVIITPLGSILEGASRPVFFRGVATVCMKLFNAMTPDRVYFGQKDGQQSVLIRRLVRDFHLGIDVRVVPTTRESDGLAMSSRNVYLGERRRQRATILNTALRICESQFKEQGIRDRKDILGPALAFVEQELQDQADMTPETRVLFELDYISLADPDTMEEVETVDDSKGAILSGALKMLPVEALQEGEDRGEADGVNRPVRLIDNIVLPPKTI